MQKYSHSNEPVSQKINKLYVVIDVINRYKLTDTTNYYNN